MLRHPAIRIDEEGVSGNRLGITFIRIAWDSIISVNEVKYRPDPLIEFFDKRSSTAHRSRPPILCFAIAGRRPSFFELRFTSTIDDVVLLLKIIDDRIGSSRPDLHISMQKFIEALGKEQLRASEASRGRKS
jgi:hypothetical protein